jgi:hypothetical protein
MWWLGPFHALLVWMAAETHFLFGEIPPLVKHFACRVENPNAVGAHSPAKPQRSIGRHFNPFRCDCLGNRPIDNDRVSARSKMQDFDRVARESLRRVAAKNKADRNFSGGLVNSPVFKTGSFCLRIRDHRYTSKRDLLDPDRLSLGQACVL